MTTGWMFVYTIQPVVKPVIQPVRQPGVSCKRGLRRLPLHCHCAFVNSKLSQTCRSFKQPLSLRVLKYFCLYGRSGSRTDERNGARGKPRPSFITRMRLKHRQQWQPLHYVKVNCQPIDIHCVHRKQLPFVCFKLLFVSMKCPTCVGLHKAT